MCELFGLSSRVATTASFSLEKLARHGAVGQPNVDGWGLAFFDARDVRLYKEPEPAGDSVWLRFILERQLECTLAISHIRRASQGALTHANTQPFTRELGGRSHVFAHNGDLRGLRGLEARGAERFRPIGETDSEQAFCILLQRLAPLWEGREPSAAARVAVIEAFAAEMREHGEANFLYSDGDLLVGHGHRRLAPAGAPGAPGLWFLERSLPDEHDALAAKGVALGPHRAGQPISMMASVPLTDEAWRPLATGQIVVLRGGRCEHLSPELLRVSV
jgi:glutamine amidotransferase